MHSYQIKSSLFLLCYIYNSVTQSFSAPPWEGESEKQCLSEIKLTIEPPPPQKKKKKKEKKKKEKKRNYKLAIANSCHTIYIVFFTVSKSVITSLCYIVSGPWWFWHKIPFHKGWPNQHPISRYKLPYHIAFCTIRLGFANIGLVVLSSWRLINQIHCLRLGHYTETKGNIPCATLSVLKSQANILISQQWWTRSQEEKAALGMHCW